MKICVYTDVHGNLEALQNLRETEDYKSADLRVFLGDILAVCPFPNECIQTVLDSGDIWLMGNHDCYYAFGLPREEFPYFVGEKRTHQRYLKKIVKKEYERIFMSLPKSYRLKIGQKILFFVHFPWESERLVRDEPYKYDAETVDELFDGVKADYIIFGHEHASHFVETEKATYLCVNALGVRHPGRYVMIDVDENHFAYEEKTVNYDLSRLKQQMIEANYPWAEEYTNYILDDE